MGVRRCPATVSRNLRRRSRRARAPACDRYVGLRGQATAGCERSCTLVLVAICCVPRRSAPAGERGVGDAACPTAPRPEVVARDGARPPPQVRTGRESGGAAVRLDPSAGARHGAARPRSRGRPHTRRRLDPARHRPRRDHRAAPAPPRRGRRAGELGANRPRRAPAARRCRRDRRRSARLRGRLLSGRLPQPLWRSRSCSASPRARRWARRSRSSRRCPPAPTASAGCRCSRSPGRL